MKRVSFYLIPTLALLLSACSMERMTIASIANKQRLSEAMMAEEVVLAFYNVQNLQEPVTDIWNSTDAAPTAQKENQDQYQQRLENLSKVLANIGDPSGPAILGLGEIGSSQAVKDLISQPTLAARGYKYIISNETDENNDMIGLLYDPDVFSYKSHKSYRPENLFHANEVLAVEGNLRNGSSLYVLVNQWPERLGGQAQTEAVRIRFAQLVKDISDEIKAENPQSNIVVMGDFNDTPSDRSIHQVLNAVASTTDKHADFYNPIADEYAEMGIGTTLFQGEWKLFDQLFVSRNLLDKESNLAYRMESANIFSPEWMMTEGMPDRAFYLDQFNPEGYSDHLPVHITLTMQIKSKDLQPGNNAGAEKAFASR